MLDRMFHEQDPVDVYECLNEDDQESVIAAGVVIEMGEAYAVETGPEHWDADAIQRSGQVDGSLELLIRHNGITWCGEPYRAGEPVFDYVRSVKDTFETPEEYYESIDDFVDCGDGSV